MSNLFESILLIEDDPGHAMIIQRPLKDLARHIVHVSNLTEAKRRLTDARFDLIITDLHLPDGNDTKIIESVMQKAPDTPLLVLTSSTSLTVAVAAMKLGARDYIVKNFSADFKDVLTLAVQRMAREALLEHERKQLQTEMAVLRIAIENSRDALALLGRDGSVTYANSSFYETIQGWGGNASHAATFLSECMPHAQRLTHSLVQRLSEDGNGGFWSTEFSVPFTGKGSDSGPLYVRLELASIFGSSGAPENGPPHWALWLRDITEEKRREKFQREILSTTTHDLKGPLGAIILSADMLVSSAAKSERVKEIALRVGSAAQGAVNIIDEFLSARRIQEGTFILKPSLHSLRSLLDEVIDSYQTMAAAKQLTLTALVEGTDATASIDRLSMVRVLGNLVTNAIKFTPKGGSIVIAAEPRDDVVVLSVRDTGHGMEPAEIQKLFERFSRLAKHADIGGSGLGLFVVRCIVEAHGGSITVSSTLGQGSTFEITLPVHPPVNAQGELVSLAFR